MIRLFSQLSQILVSLNELSLQSDDKELGAELFFDDLNQGVVKLTCYGFSKNLKELISLFESASFEILKESQEKVEAQVKIIPSDDFEIDADFFIHQLKEFTEFFTLKLKYVLKEEALPLNQGVNPLWRKDSSDAEYEEYKDFYSRLYQMDPDEDVSPWIYVKIYEPVRVEGILFFKKFNPYNVVPSQEGVKVLLDQAVVSESFLSSWLPEFFSEAFGVLEIKDVPYSERFRLENSSILKDLSKEIGLNVAASIRRLNRKNRAEYEVIWPSVSFFVKKGCMSDPGFDEFMRPHVLYKSFTGEYKTLDELFSDETSQQGDKLSRLVYYYDKDSVNRDLLKNASHLEAVIVEIDSFVDPLFIQFEESSVILGRKIVLFESVENAFVELGEVEKEDSQEIKNLLNTYLLDKKEKEESEVSGDLKVEVKAYPQDIPELFFCIDETSRRAFYNTRLTLGIDQWPIDMLVVINSKHPRIQKLLEMPEGERLDFLSLMYSSASSHIWGHVPHPSIKD